MTFVTEVCGRPMAPRRRRHIHSRRAAGAGFPAKIDFRLNDLPAPDCEDLGVAEAMAVCAAALIGDKGLRARARGREVGPTAGAFIAHVSNANATFSITCQMIDFVVLARADVLDFDPIDAAHRLRRPRAP
jgi:hypothetical protein